MKKGEANENKHADWYNDIVKKAGLAEASPVRGCMIIKPYGYALWENIQSVLDRMFKETGHVNAYFPLLIPKSFLSKEAEHIEGFAKECAVVTHYRLRSTTKGGGIEVDPEAKLEEELIVRPTSETIIWHAFKDWIKSYRDLPILINQWANVVRWEMRTRPFLRTSEFLWQEGHTAHQTKEEAIKEAERMLNIYATFMEEYMALPVIKGVKSEAERFAGAVTTYCVEALMKDGKALQAGTSHFLGQNFAKAFNVQFLNQKNTLEHVWATSWGVSARLIGALIMAHSDEKGLVLPPKLAPIQVVIVPIYFGGKSTSVLNEYTDKIVRICTEKNIRYKVNTDEQARPGWKFAEYEMQGVPLRIAFGMRDIASQTIELFRRDDCTKEIISIEEVEQKMIPLLTNIQKNMYEKAKEFTETNTTAVDSWSQFEEVIKEKKGFISAHWDQTKETEKVIKEKTKATIRCIPNDPAYKEQGKCVLTGKESNQRVLFAIAY